MEAPTARFLLLLVFSCLCSGKAVSQANDTLTEALKRGIFYNEGIHTRKQEYTSIPMMVSYNEQEHGVQCTECAWEIPTGQWAYDWEWVGHDAPVYPQPRLDQVAAPPLGYRSAPPLGGMGAGSVELRGDGTFSQWTILNQGPSGSGKYGVVDDVYMAARINGKARMLRTTPPKWATKPEGIEELKFSGTYPMTRLVVRDETLLPGAGNETGTMSVHGYSTLTPSNLKESAAPAFVLSLTVSNPGPEPMAAEFMVNLPFGDWPDCSRSSPDSTVVPSMASSTACMKACARGCASWEFDTGTKVCLHNKNIPLTASKPGSRCGVRSDLGWEEPRMCAPMRMRPVAATAQSYTGASTRQVSLGQGPVPPSTR